MLVTLIRVVQCEVCGESIRIAAGSAAFALLAHVHRKPLAKVQPEPAPAGVHSASA